MIMSQKYNSINQIDTEFIPSLEELLADKIPHFQMLKDYEKNAPEDINFAYYLFFSNQTNSPIGFAGLELKNGKPIKKPFLKKLLKKDPVSEQFEKSVKWSILGENNEGIIFNPRYLKSASEGALKVLNELSEREDITDQDIFYSEAYSKISELTGNPATLLKEVPDVLIKNYSAYQDFYLALNEQCQKEIRSAWKIVQKDLGLEMRSYESFKHCFQYKLGGPKQYKELRSHPLLEKYNQEDTPVTFISLESKTEIKLLLIIIHGQCGNIFYDLLYSDEQIPSIIIHQLATMNFYEFNEASKLHFLGDSKEDDHLLKIGFKTKKVSRVKIPKVTQ